MIEKFVGNASENIGLPFQLSEYLELVDWTGRILLPKNRGAINPNIPPILERLGFDNKQWRTLTTTFETQFSYWSGQEESVKKMYTDKHYQRIPSTKNCRTLLG